MSFIERSAQEKTTLVARSAQDLPDDQQWLIYRMPFAENLLVAVVDTHTYSSKSLNFLLRLVAR